MTTSALQLDAAWPASTPISGFARRCLGELLFWLVVLQIISGIFLQGQLALLGGRVLIPGGVPKMGLAVLIVLCAAGAIVAQRGRVAWSHCILPASLFACYLAADLAWLLEASRLPAGAVLLGFNKYFLYFAVLPFAVLLRPGISEARITTRLLWMLLPLVALAAAQFVLNDPILAVASEDEKFEIPAVDFYGQIRAFSLFRGVLDCGQGMAFFGGLLVARICAKPRFVVINFVLLLATAACCAVTFRRGAYLEYAATTGAAFAISRRWPITGWLPWVYGGAAVALASAGTLISSSQGVLSSETLTERHDAWNMALETWLHREDASLWFGTGLAQIESTDIEPHLVDNGFLSVASQLGLVGLALWCWLMHSMWRDALHFAWTKRSTFAVAVAALLSTWMMRNVFDPVFALYPLYVYLLFWSQPAETKATATRPAPAFDGRLASPCT